MLSQTLDNLAHELFEADRQGTQGPLLHTVEPDARLHDAYAVQEVLIDRWRAAGVASLGWKIGFTNPGVQQAMGLEQPVRGVLLADRRFAADQPIPSTRFKAVRLEAEIAFALAKDVSGPNCTPEMIAAATETVCPAIELIDSRVLTGDGKDGSAPDGRDMVADNVAFAGLILGELRHRVADFDLAEVAVTVFLNGEGVAAGTGAQVLGSPLHAMAWLANHLAAHGKSLKAGDWVLAGSLIPHFACPPGAQVLADFGQFGRLEVRFS